MPIGAWVLLVLLVTGSWIGGVAIRAGYLRRIERLYFHPYQVRFLRNSPVAMLPAACFFTSMLGVVVFGSTQESANVPMIADVFAFLLFAFGLWFVVVAIWPPEFLSRCG